jgi:hypothetical protein
VSGVLLQSVRSMLSLRSLRLRFVVFVYVLAFQAAVIYAIAKPEENCCEIEKLQVVVCCWMNVGRENVGARFGK